MGLNRTLILHVGTDKTGTSALQLLFSANPGPFQRAGVYYPETGRAKHHQHHLLFAPICSFSDRAGFENDVPWAEALTSLAAELDPRPEPRILLSSELLTQGVDFAALAQLRDMFADLRVVLYLRRQDHYVTSRYEQSVKTLGACEPFAADSESVPDYWELAQAWEAFAGSPERLIVRPYEKEQFHGGSIFADFLHHALDMEFGAGFVLPENRDTNPRLHPDAAEFLRLANRHRQPRGAVSLLWHLTGYSLQQAPDTLDPFTRCNQMAPSARRAILERCRAGNARVAERYLGRADGALFAEYAVAEAPGATGGQGLTADSCLDIARYLIASLVDNPAVSPADTFRDLRLVETLVAEVVGAPPGARTRQPLLADFQGLLRDAEFRFVENQAAHRGTALAEKDVYIAQQQQALDDQADALRQKDGYIAEQQRALEGAAAALRQKDDYIAQQQQVLDGHADALRQKDDYVAQQQRALEGMADAVHQKDGYIAQQQQALDGQADALRQKDAYIAQQRQALEEDARALGNLQGRVAQLEAYLSALRAKPGWRIVASLLRWPAMPGEDER